MSSLIMPVGKPSFPSTMLSPQSTLKRTHRDMSVGVEQELEYNGALPQFSLPSMGNGGGSVESTVQTASKSMPLSPPVSESCLEDPAPTDPSEVAEHLDGEQDVAAAETQEVDRADDPEEAEEGDDGDIQGQAAEQINIINATATGHISNYADSVQQLMESALAELQEAAGPQMQRITEKAQKLAHALHLNREVKNLMN